MNNINVLILLLFSVNFVNSAIQLDNSCTKRPQSCDDDAFSVADFLICGGNAYGAEVPNAKKGTGKRGSGCAFTENCVEVFPSDEIDSGASAWGTNAITTCGSNKIQLNGYYDSTLSNENQWMVREDANAAINVPHDHYTTQEIANWLASGTHEIGGVVFTEQWLIMKHGADASTEVKISMYTKLMNNELVVLAAKKAACAKWMAAGTAVCQPAAWFPWTIVGVLVLLVGGLGFYFYKKKNKQYKAKTSKKGGSSKLYGYHRRNARVFEDGI